MANEIDLNELAIKTDSLPDAWKVLLIDPTTGLPAKNMAVAKFVELLTKKLPAATSNSNGLFKSQDFENTIMYRGYITKDQTNNTVMPGMYFHKEKISSTGPVYGCLLVMRAHDICIQVDFPLASPYQISFRSGNNARVGQTPVWEAGDTWYKLLAGTFDATSANALTDTITPSPQYTEANTSMLLNNNLLPPPQIACQATQSQAVLSSNLRSRLCRKQPAQMVQLQLKLNLPSSTSGRLTRSDVLYLNYKKKIRDLNKSSISLKIARYNKCNLPRAGPPRLIN